MEVATYPRTNVGKDNLVNTLAWIANMIFTTERALCISVNPRKRAHMARTINDKENMVRTVLVQPQDAVT